MEEKKLKCKGQHPPEGRCNNCLPPQEVAWLLKTLDQILGENGLQKSCSLPKSYVQPMSTAFYYPKITTL